MRVVSPSKQRSSIRTARNDCHFPYIREKAKELMWEYRGDLPMAVGSAKELVVGEAGFIDGWVIVIGPAVNYTGAAYRLRYPEIEQYLRKGHSGGYY